MAERQVTVAMNAHTIHKQRNAMKFDVKSGFPLCTITYMLQCLIPIWRVSEPEDNTPSGPQGLTSSISIGSSAEGLSVPTTFQRSQQHKYTYFTDSPTQRDIDVMIVYNKACTLGKVGDSLAHIFEDCSGTQPGYVRLKHVPTSVSERTGKCQVESTFGETIQSEHAGKTETYMTFDHLGPSLAKHMTRTLQTEENMVANCIMPHDQNVVYDYTFSGPASTVIGSRHHDNENILISSVDLAIAIKCPYWPDVAAGWKSRFRHSGWPGGDLVTKVTQDGCHFVKVPDARSTHPEIEWRFSFVCAEKELVRSLSKTQRQCYQLFKLLVGYIVKPISALSSYCLKNILFWTLEKIPRDAWHDQTDGLATGWLGLLDELIMCLSQCNLPQYFIPENNLLRYRDPVFIENICQKVIHLRKNPVNIVFHFDSQFMFRNALPPLKDTFEVKRLTTKIYGKCSLIQFVSERFYAQLRLLSDHAQYSHISDFANMVDDMQFMYPHFDWLEYCTHKIKSHNMPKMIKATILRGYAWCGFWYRVAHHNTKWDDLAQQHHQLFLHSLSLSADQNMFVKTAMYLAIFLHQYGRYEEASRHLDRVIPSTRSHDTSDHELTCIQLELEISPLLDTCFQMEMNCFSKLIYPSLVFAYYLLIKCYIQTGRSEKADVTIEQFESLCFSIKSASSVRVRSICPYIYGLLGHTYLALGKRQQAFDTFQIQYECAWQPHTKKLIREKLGKLQRTVK